MRKRLPPLSEMEHITSKELGEHLDAILERINSENVGLVIDHEGKSYVLCPADWFDMPDMKHFETLLKNAVRYTAAVDESDLAETAETVISLGTAISEECVVALLDIIKDKTSNDYWTMMKASLKETLTTFRGEL